MSKDKLTDSKLRTAKPEIKEYNLVDHYNHSSRHFSFSAHRHQPGTALCHILVNSPALPSHAASLTTPVFVLPSLPFFHPFPVFHF